MKLLLCSLLIVFTFSQTITNPFSSTGRYYWVGGLFTNVTSVNSTTNTKTTISAGNIAQWDGESWSGTLGMGTGTDGEVRRIKVDQCNNVYVAGRFGKVNGVATGPIARWRPKTKVWEAVGTSGQVSWGSGSYINAIAIDCANLPDSSLECPCDVYLGGSFSAVIDASKKVAQNVIKYSYSTKSWDDLGSQGLINGEVHALFKKGFGFTQATNYLYVGGNSTVSNKGGFTKYNTKTKTWGYDTPSSAGTVTGTVYSFYYKAYTLSTDLLYVGGDFTWVRGSVTVKNVAQFNWDLETIQAVGSNSPAAAVFSLGWGGSGSGGLFLGGAEATASLSYTRKNLEPSSTTSSWTKISGTVAADISNINKPVRDISVCNSYGIYDCTAGSVAMVGTDGYLKYYNIKTDQFVNFGEGTNGDLRTIESSYLLSGTSSIQVSFFVLFALVLIFFN